MSKNIFAALQTFDSDESEDSVIEKIKNVVVKDMNDLTSRVSEDILQKQKYNYLQFPGVHLKELWPELKPLLEEELNRRCIMQNRDTIQISFFEKPK